MKKIYGLFIGIFFIFLSLFSIAFSENEIRYIYFDIIAMEENYVVAYEILVDDIDGSVLEVKVSYDGSLLENVCELPRTGVREKASCEVKKMGDGLYKFDAILYNPSGEVVDTLSTQEYLFEGVTARYEFEILENKMEVNLVLDGEGEDIVVLNRIPKEVIEYLDDDNKNSLITSGFEYEILESDPLIAWSVERVPGNINYTINKKINEEDLNNFDIEVTKQSTSFKLVKLFVIFLLIGILGFVFKPVFVKNKRK